MIVGDSRKFLSALIVPDGPQLEAEMSRLGLAIAPSEWRCSPEVQKIFAERIQTRLSDLAECEQIGKFALIEQPFTVDREELTPTLKLRREIIAAHYADVIDSLYSC
jgi:long-chain acyl-CoA synthetase